MSNEIFESVLVRFSKEFPDVKFRQAIYKGNLIDNSLTLSENKIEEEAKILLPEVENDNDNEEINIKKNKDDFDFNSFMNFINDLENMKNF
jgi:hypothetical protein